MMSINWNTLVIFVPQADLTQVSAQVYSLDISDLWAWLKDIEDSEDGQVFKDTHVRRAARTIAGVTYAPELEIINGYTVEFEDGQYVVNIVGGNNNIVDVRVFNQVSLNPSNSAGSVTVPAVVTPQQIVSHLRSEKFGALEFDKIIKMLCTHSVGRSSRSTVGGKERFMYYDDDNNPMFHLEIDDDNVTRHDY